MEKLLSGDVSMDSPVSKVRDYLGSEIFGYWKMCDEIKTVFY